MNNEELNNKTIMEEIRKLGCYPSEFDVARHFFALGKQEQKEQMMKEAVEGEIVESDGKCDKCFRYDHSAFVNAWLKYNIGDKVRIIIVKED